jgi:ABC-type multidrug transport system fused ATPase/permease subunit
MNEYLIYILLLFFFFIYGVLLSKFIDHLFDDFEEEIGDAYILLEIFFEISLTYIIYYLSLEPIRYMIRFFYAHLNMNTNKSKSYDSFLVAFSLGIFYHMEKYNHKLSHIYLKYMHI